MRTMTAEGDVRVVRPSGEEIKSADYPFNLFDTLAEHLATVPSAQALDFIVITNRAGEPLARYRKDGTTWSRQ